MRNLTKDNHEVMEVRDWKLTRCPLKLLKVPNTRPRDDRSSLRSTSPSTVLKSISQTKTVPSKLPPANLTFASLTFRSYRG